jgi:hypothetical protein
MSCSSEDLSSGSRLIVPLARLERAVRIGAWGIVFVPEDEKKRRALAGRV